MEFLGTGLISQPQTLQLKLSVLPLAVPFYVTLSWLYPLSTIAFKPARTMVAPTCFTKKQSLYYPPSCGIRPS